MLMSVVLALWCVFALACGDARAFCLDLGGDCSPSAMTPEGPCHDRTSGGGTNSRCSSCVDILVHEDASANGSRPEDELRTPAPAQSPGSAQQAFVVLETGIAAFPASQSESPAQNQFPRTTVLRI